MLKKSKLEAVCVATKVPINAQCDQDRQWSASHHVVNGMLRQSLFRLPYPRHHTWEAQGGNAF
ncbi:protein of unknown function [Serratia sp. Tan611]|nr:protein of unknown function [Serratia sp. Tan611]